MQEPEIAELFDVVCTETAPNTTMKEPEIAMQAPVYAQSCGGGGAPSEAYPTPAAPVSLQENALRNLMMHWARDLLTLNVTQETAGANSTFVVHPTIDPLDQDLGFMPAPQSLQEQEQSPQPLQPQQYHGMPLQQQASLEQSDAQPVQPTTAPLAEQPTDHQHKTLQPTAAPLAEQPTDHQHETLQQPANHEEDPHQEHIPDPVQDNAESSEPTPSQQALDDLAKEFEEFERQQQEHIQEQEDHHARLQRDRTEECMCA